MKSGGVPPAWSTRQRLAFTKRAGQLNQQLFGANNIQLPLRWRTSAELSRDDCRFADGERFLRQALTVQEKLLGTKSPIIADTLADLGECLYLEDKDTDAESILHRSGALYRASGNPNGRCGQLSRTGIRAQRQGNGSHRLAARSG